MTTTEPQPARRDNAAARITRLLRAVEHARVGGASVMPLDTILALVAPTTHELKETDRG